MDWDGQREGTVYKSSPGVTLGYLTCQRQVGRAQRTPCLMEVPRERTDKSR